MAPVWGLKDKLEEKAMKKYTWLVALVIALSLALVGCPGGGGGSGPGPGPGGDGPEVVSLPPFVLTLADNFQYGEGYQGLVENSKLFPEGAITEGDVYTLKITFTVDRALEDSITVGLVDRTDPPDGDYWIPLSYDAEDDGWDYDEDDAPAIAATKEEAADAATVTKIITFTALHSALSDAAKANCIAFETQGEGTTGEANSGVKGVVKMSFTEFLFVKGTADDLEGVQPPVYQAPLAVTFGAADPATPVTVTGGASIAYIAGPPTGYTVTYNPTGSNDSNGNVIARFKVDLGGALADFESVTLTYQGGGGDIAYKNVHVLAAATEAEITGWKADTAIMAMIVSVKDTEKQFYQFGKQVNGTAAQDLTLDIENPGALTGEVWFAFYMAVDASKTDDGDNVVPTSFSISNVKFVYAAE